MGDGTGRRVSPFWAGLRTGVLQDLVGQFRLTDLSLNPFEVYDAPVKLAAADADFRLTLDPFAIHLGQMQNPRREQCAVCVSGVCQRKRTGGATRLTVKWMRSHPARLLELWPAKAAAPTRNWLVANPQKGQAQRSGRRLARARQSKPINTYFSFEYDEATVRYSPNLPQVENARGQASMIDNRFVVAVNSGHVTPPQGGADRCGGLVLYHPRYFGTRGGRPQWPACAPMERSRAALSLLNLAPLDVMDEAGLPVTLADGRAALGGHCVLAAQSGA